MGHVIELKLLMLLPFIKIVYWKKEIIGQPVVSPLSQRFMRDPSMNNSQKIWPFILIIIYQLLGLTWYTEYTAKIKEDWKNL